MVPFVRRAEERDRTAVEAIAGEALAALRDSPSVAQWGAEMRRGFIERWLPTGVIRERHRFVVAEVDGELVGGGSVQHGDRHPHAFMRICVRPHLRGHGFGAVLFESLIEDDAGPFVVREMLSDPATVAFYTNRGFVTGERTLEGMIDPRDERIAAWCGSVLSRPSQVVVGEGGGRASEEELAEATDRLYRWTHAWSPPRDLQATTAVRTYLGPALPNGVLAAWIDGELIGVSLLTESPFDDARGVAHLASCGVAEPHVPAGADATRRLLAASLRKGAREGWITEVEANDGNRFLWDALKDLPGTKLFSDMTLLVSRPGLLDPAPVT